MIRKTACLTALLVVGGASLPSESRACGSPPPSGEQIEAPGRALEHLLRDPELPLLDVSWSHFYWVIAWARDAGKTFSDAEVAALLGTRDTGGEAPSRAWLAARRAALEAMGAEVTPAIVETYRRDGYAYALRCYPDGFETAVETLAARRAEYTDAELRDWIEGQDAAFERCSNPAAPLPSPVEDTARERLRDDRAYQIATATLNAGEWSLAAARFDSLAESTSAWADIARYRAAFARYQAGTRDPRDLRARLATTTDTKAHRGLVQLLDRAELFQRSHAEITDALTHRLLTEDLGEDAPRVVRDIATFAECDTDVGYLFDGGCAELYGPRHSRLIDLQNALRARDFPAPPAAGRRSPLRISVAFLEARRALHAHDLPAARAALRRGTTRARRSTRATIAAFRDLSLSLHTSDVTVAQLISPHEAEASELHAAARSVIRTMSSARLRVLARDPRLSERSRREIAEDGIVRSVLLDRASDLRAFLSVRRGLPDPEWAGPRTYPDPDADRIDQLRALLSPGLDELALGDELSGGWTTPSIGCDLGACRAGHPGSIAVSLPIEDAWLEPSEESAALAAHGNRVDALGDAILEVSRLRPRDPRVPDLLAGFVGLTRFASMHRRHDERMGVLSRRAFERLHRRYPDADATARTRHWYR